MYKTTDMLSVRISTCRCFSCGWKSLELSTLLPAPSGLCATGSEVLTTALKSACPRTLLTGLQLMRQSWPRHVTSPSPGEPLGWRGLVARSQSFDVATGDHDAQTARGPRRPRHSRFQPKLQRAHVFFSKLPSLKRHREDKMAACFQSKHTPRYVRLTRGENALMHIHA